MEKNNNLKKVWILEKSEKPLKFVKKETDNYILRGPCADFNDVNDNGRLYDKEDYLSHFAYLIPQIEKRSLLGEPDHNEEYDVSMKQISHIITKLWYDEKLNEVWIEIEIPDTHYGKDIKALIDKNVPIYISSRATGFVNENNNDAVIDTIYTYDIVYRPGFAIAELKLKDLSEKYGPNISIYEWKKPQEKINKERKIMEPVTKNELVEMHNELSEAFNSLKSEVIERLNKHKNEEASIKIYENISKEKDENKLVIGFINKQNEVLNRQGNIIKDLSESYNKSIDQINLFEKYFTKVHNYIQNLENHYNDSIEKFNFMNEAVSRFKLDYEKLKKSSNSKINLLENHIQKITENYNLAADNINVLIDEKESLEEKLLLVLNKTNEVIDSTNEIIDETNNLNNNTKKLSENFNNVVNNINDQVDQNIESLNSQIISLMDSLEKEVYFGKKLIDEEGNIISVVDYDNGKIIGVCNKQECEYNISDFTPESKFKFLTDLKNIKTESQKLTESMKVLKKSEKKIDEIELYNLKKKYPFFQNLNENDQTNFRKLSDFNKKKLSEVIEESGSNSKFSQIFESIQNDDLSKFLMGQTMPKEIFENWKMIPAGDKANLVNLFRARNPKSQLEAEAIWENLNFNKNFLEKEEEVDLDLGYDIDKVKF
jgi:methyl-accepting chemotaxis protein